MKLNYECMRDVLITLEEVLDLDDNFDYKDLKISEIANMPVLSNKYNPKDIAYCVYMLSETGHISVVPGHFMELPKVNGNVVAGAYTGLKVTSLTYKGHEFTQQIRNENVWSKVKEKIKPLGVMTIDIISQAAATVITQMLNP